MEKMKKNVIHDFAFEKGQKDFHNSDDGKNIFL